MLDALIRSNSRSRREKEEKKEKEEKDEEDKGRGKKLQLILTEFLIILGIDKCSAYIILCNLTTTL